MGLRAKAFRSLDSLPLRPSLLTQCLPVDSLAASTPNTSESEHFSRMSRAVPRAAYSHVKPEPAPNPKLLAVSPSALSDLDLSEEVTKTDEFLQVFSGNTLLRETQPWSLCYAGHQFGVYAGQLGDGRAMSLFETENSRGERWDVQLKGAGRTPYSRFGDGYAVLRSSIREFLVSEYMHALGVSTTRALCLMGTTRDVFRDDAPPGIKQPERGAIVTRMAPSWIRFGNFEIFYARDDMNNVRRLADYVLEHVVKDEEEGEGSVDGNKYAKLLYRISRKTSRMVASWQAIGFNHGVMNTDNMSVLGLTLDYGPYQFFDFYDPDYICNHSDFAGRYAFKQQPTICIYNLLKLAIPLFELIGASGEVDSLVFPKADHNQENNSSIDQRIPTDESTRTKYWHVGRDLATEMMSEQFSTWFMDDLAMRMREKLGISAEKSDQRDMEDLIIPLLEWMTDYGVDYHSFFRSLSRYKITDAGEAQDEAQADLIIRTHDPNNEDTCKAALSPWLAMYRHRLLQNGHLDNDQRQRLMNKVNPRFVLRNWVVEEVIQAFNDRSDEEAKSVLEACFNACTHPFRDKYTDEQIERWVTSPVPEWGKDMRCSCSS